MNENAQNILKELNSQASWVSGRGLATSLGIGHTSVGRGIAALRDEGFIIKSAPGKGYKLQFDPTGRGSPRRPPCESKKKGTDDHMSSINCAEVPATTSGQEVASWQDWRRSFFGLWGSGLRLWLGPSKTRKSASVKPKSKRPSGQTLAIGSWFQLSPGTSTAIGLLLIFGMAIYAAIPSIAANLSVPMGSYQPFTGGTGQSVPQEKASADLGVTNSGPAASKDKTTAGPQMPSHTEAVAAKSDGADRDTINKAEIKDIAHVAVLEAMNKARLEERIRRLETEMVGLKGVRKASTVEAAAGAKHEEPPTPTPKEKKTDWRLSGKYKKNTLAQKHEKPASATATQPAKTAPPDLSQVVLNSVVQSGDHWVATLMITGKDGSKKERLVQVGDLVEGKSVADISWNKVVLSGDAGKAIVLHVD